MGAAWERQTHHEELNGSSNEGRALVAFTSANVAPSRKEQSSSAPSNVAPIHAGLRLELGLHGEGFVRVVLRRTGKVCAGEVHPAQVGAREVDATLDFEIRPAL